MTVDRQKMILLVEDEAIISRMQKKTLENYGYKVISAYKGEAAVQLCDTSPDIDLVLMDINLGEGMDGTEAAEIILSRHDIPLIFLSTHSEREIVEKTESNTSYGYILKTAGETVLITSIKMAFRLFDAKMEERKKNDLLREKEKNLAEAERVAKLGHWKFNISTNAVFWSEELFNIFEVDKDSFGGRYESFIINIHHEDRVSVLEKNKMIRETGEDFELEYRIVSSDGTVKYIMEIGYATKDENGKLTELF